MCSYGITIGADYYDILLKVSLCIDDSCTTTPLLMPEVRLPKPSCSRRRKRDLPGEDGSIMGFMDHLRGRQMGDVAVTMVMEELDMDVSEKI